MSVLENLPCSKPRISDAVEHKVGGRLGPTTNEGRTVTRLIPFSLQNSHAAFSAMVLDSTYQILSRSQNSTELQDDSSMATFLGSKSSLTLSVEDDEVKTTRLNDGFFLHERSTFSVPSTAGFKISPWKMCTFKKKMAL